MKPTLAFLRQLIGNPNAYSVQQIDGSWHPVRAECDDGILHMHLERKATVGTYVNKGALARTLVFDIDDDDLDATVRIRAALRDMGIPLPYSAVEFSGRKGYHVWVVLADYVPAEQLRRLGRSVLALAEVECEVFPKQDEATDLGNLIKLPGGIHQVTGKPNDFLGPLPTALPALRFQEQVVPNLPEAFRGRSAGAGRSRWPCLEAVQQGIEAGGRNNAMVQFATLMRLSGLDGDPLWAAMVKVNEKFSPPLEDAELEGVFRSSERTGPICDQLPADRQCGELCIREKSAGLKVVPGRLRHAVLGQSVVVTLGGRGADGVVYLNHDDLDTCKGRLNDGR